MLLVPETRSQLELELCPGEALWAQPGTVTNLEADLEVSIKLYGGLVGAGLRRLLSPAPVRMIEVRNVTESNRHLMLTPPVPGEIMRLDAQSGIVVSASALLALRGTVRLRPTLLSVAKQFTSGGFDALGASGTGEIWLSAFGCLIRKEVRGELQIDPSHLLAYQGEISFHSTGYKPLRGKVHQREKSTTRVLRGRGEVILQSRSLSALASWLCNVR